MSRFKRGSTGEHFGGLMSKQKLPKLMWPTYIEFIKDLPYTPTFKVEKLKLIKDGLTKNAWKME